MRIFAGAVRVFFTTSPIGEISPLPLSQTSDSFLLYFERSGFSEITLSKQVLFSELVDEMVKSAESIGLKVLKVSHAVYFVSWPEPNLSKRAKKNTSGNL